MTMPGLDFRIANRSTDFVETVDHPDRGVLPVSSRSRFREVLSDLNKNRRFMAHA
jgi:hypothetical protein